MLYSWFSLKKAEISKGENPDRSKGEQIAIHDLFNKIHRLISYTHKRISAIKEKQKTHQKRTIVIIKELFFL